MANPKKIGRYKIERAIAKGGTAYVYLAQDPQLKRQVAIKWLDEEFTDDPQFRARFQREAEVIASLEHPHIVPIYDIGEQKSQLYIVMRYMTGGTMASRFRGKPVPNNEILKIIRRMASALQVAHEHGIVHRDIKPGNILFDKWGDSYLSDFGIVKLLDSEDQSSERSLIGTPAYLSPEQAQGITDVTPQSDIYSLGVVLFQMLTGRLPFWSKDPFELVSLHINDPIPSLLDSNPDCKPGYQAIINRAMAKYPQQRYTSANAMVHAIESLFSPSDTLDLPIEEVYPNKSNRVGSSPPTNLPNLDHEVIGREEEIQTLTDFLMSSDQQLMTITGPGGIGKTFLANHVARENLEHFTDGAYMVSISTSHSPEQIPQRIANAINLPIYDPSDPLTQLSNYIGNKKILLVVDNFDGFIQYGFIIRKIIDGSEKLKVLLTSRERLNDQNGDVIELDGLPYPDEHSTSSIDDYESVRLFLSRAKKVQSSFELNEENRKFTAEICKLLNGVPLAIELASSWTRLLSPREIAKEISTNADFLVATDQSQPDRHHSLKVVFEQSWKLLEKEEQSALSRLSIFHNKFSRSAATEITSVSAQVLLRLADKSLLQEVNGDFRIYEMIRLFATRKYHEHNDTTILLRKNFTRYYLKLIEDQHPNLIGENQKKAIEVITAEIDNITTAWLWCVRDQLFGKLQIFIEGLYNFYEIIGWINDGKTLFKKGLLYLNDANTRTKEHFSIKNLVRSRLGAFCYRTGDYDEGINYLNQTLNELDPQDASSIRAFILTYLGAIAYQKGEFDQANELLSDSVKLYDELDDSRGKAIALHHNALLKHTQGHQEQAISLHKRSLSISESINNQFGISISLNHIGLISLELGEFLEADINLKESLRIRENLKDIWGIARSQVGLGQLALQRGKVVSAEKHLNQALNIFDQISDARGISSTLIELSKIHSNRGEYELGKEKLARAIQLSASIRAVPLALEAMIHYANTIMILEEYEDAARCLIFAFGHQACGADTRKWAIKLYNQVKEELASDEISLIQSQILSKSIEDLANQITGEPKEKEET